MRKILFGAAVAALAFTSGSASAAEFLFSFTANNAVGSGTFITQDTANADGGYLITNTSGTLVLNANSATITGPNNFAGADNLLYAYQDPLLDFDGTSFHLSNGINVNIYYANGYRYIRTNGDPQRLDSFTVTPVLAAVPEPATWAMMIAGFGAIGGALRRRTVRAAFA